MWHYVVDHIENSSIAYKFYFCRTDCPIVPGGTSEKKIKDMQFPLRASSQNLEIRSINLGLVSTEYSIEM